MYESGLWLSLSAAGTCGLGWSYPHPCYLRNTIFCENLGMRVSFGRRFPLQEPVDQGGLNQALHICKTLRYEGWTLAASSRSRNRWIRVVLPTPLLPAEHNICENTYVWEWSSLPTPGTGRSGWSYPRPCYLHKHNIFKTHRHRSRVQTLASFSSICPRPCFLHSQKSINTV